MKITFVFPRFSGPYGGERFLARLAGSLADDHRVTVVTRKYDPALALIDPRIDVRVSGVLAGVGGHNVANVLDLLFMPLAVLKVPRGQDRVVGMGWQTTFGLWWLALLRRYRTPALVYFCLEPPRFAYDLRERTRGWKRAVSALPVALIKAVDRAGVRAAGTIMAIGDWTEEQVREIYDRPAEPVYPGIEMERFQRGDRASARRALGLDAGATVYVTVSKIHPRKRLEESVAEFDRRRDATARYFIIGDGPWSAALRELTAGRTDISVLGQRSDDEVTRYLKAADFFIFTAVNEPYGMAPIEAQVAGCRVVPVPPKYPALSWPEATERFLAALP